MLRLGIDSSGKLAMEGRLAMLGRTLGFLNSFATLLLLQSPDTADLCARWWNPVATGSTHCIGEDTKDELRLPHNPSVVGSIPTGPTTTGPTRKVVHS